MDPFEVRMQFIALLKRLDASQQSIKKIVGFAMKFFPSCGEDLWDCILEECQKGSLNSRINLLYLLDSLCEACLVTKPPPGSTQTSASYVDYVTRDLRKIVDSVVPEGRQGLPNLMSTRQILESWRSKRLVEPTKVDEVLATLEERRAAVSVNEGADRPKTERRGSALSPEEIKEGIAFRKKALKSPDVDLAAIARTAPAISSSPTQPTPIVSDADTKHLEDRVTYWA
ncbi:hypothetical protein NUW54_g10926 [Trametes sanguinea]|uniref:Uncharacterized protein n=1 Tax=Trametes sanguinea TaxID=158606 RepID=A0ACC1NPN5_9APHY|nr:hypothetical protein NUW54_g10926 [Trametes sanguinea]